jgi:hypothetical protein
VTSRHVDRDTWAAVVEEIIAERYRGHRGAKAAFARAAGVEPRTVSRWLGREVDVREESVRQVADAHGINPLAILVRVGYYRPDEVTIAPTPPPEVDEEVALIMSAPVSQALKERMLQRLAELRAADRDRRMDEIRFALDTRRR